MAKRKGKGSQQYIGDQILAAGQGVSCCCGLTLLSVLAAVSFSFVAKPQFLKDFEKQNPTDIWLYLNDPKYTLPIGLVLSAFVVFHIYWTIATWRSKRWALWCHLIFQAPGATMVLILGSNRLDSLWSILISAYCFLRLAGKLGPKLRS